MINWFDMPAEGLSNGGEFEIKELTATENKVYETPGEVYNKVTVNVEGGGGSSDFSTANVTFNSRPIDGYEVVVPYCDEPSGLGLLLHVNTSDEPFTLQVPIYKGDASQLLSTSTLILSGDIEAGGDVTIFGLRLKVYYITGDCSIS